MNSRYRLKRNKLVAWLGILAMWLAVVAPVISQTLAASAREALLTAQSWPLCTEHDHRHAEGVSSQVDVRADSDIVARADHVHWMTSAAPDSPTHQAAKPGGSQDFASNVPGMPDASGMPGMDHQIDSHGGACAYCGLLADHPPIAATVLAPFVGTADLVQSVSSIPTSVFVVPHYDASRPRAPPSFVS